MFKAFFIKPFEARRLDLGLFSLVVLSTVTEANSCEI